MRRTESARTICSSRRNRGLRSAVCSAMGGVCRSWRGVGKPRPRLVAGQACVLGAWTRSAMAPRAPGVRRSEVVRGWSSRRAREQEEGLRYPTNSPPVKTSTSPASRAAFTASSTPPLPVNSTKRGGPCVSWPSSVARHHRVACQSPRRAPAPPRSRARPGSGWRAPGEASAPSRPFGRWAPVAVHAIDGRKSEPIVSVARLLLGIC
jgi:hypothetical protein